MDGFYFIGIVALASRSDGDVLIRLREEAGGGREAAKLRRTTSGRRTMRKYHIIVWIKMGGEKTRLSKIIRLHPTGFFWAERFLLDICNGEKVARTCYKVLYTRSLIALTDKTSRIVCCTQAGTFWLLILSSCESLGVAKSTAVQALASLLSWYRARKVRTHQRLCVFMHRLVFSSIRRLTRSGTSWDVE